MNFGDWRRLEPVSRVFGADRGRPIDRHYIESFLERNAKDVRGRVLEFGDATYTRRFGEARVTSSDVVNYEAEHVATTIVADIASADSLPRARFDCIICTQVLMYVFDSGAALRTLRDALAPGGTLLTTFPGVSQISSVDMERFGDYWRFTRASARRLFAQSFGEEAIVVESFGNVLTACAFLQGLTVDELTLAELDHADPQYEVTVTVRAVKEAL